MRSDNAVNTHIQYRPLRQSIQVFGPLRANWELLSAEHRVPVLCCALAPYSTLGCEVRRSARGCSERSHPDSVGSSESLRGYMTVWMASQWKCAPLLLLRKAVGAEAVVL